YQNHSFLYNAALKKTAAYTTDRRVLFEYITSEEFQQHSIAKRIKKRRKAEERVNEDTDIEQAIAVGRKEADQVLEPELYVEETKQEKAAVSDKNITESEIEDNKHQSDSDQPVQFDKNQSRSFSDWLKL